MGNQFDRYGKAYDAMIYWYVTKACNFECPQCAGTAVKPGENYKLEKINVPALKSFLKKLNKTIKICFTGGEPLLVHNIIEAFSAITKQHYISLISNLVSSKVGQFTEIIDPERVAFIVGSAHMLELEKKNLVDRFISNCILLKNAGFTLHVTEVAYPFMIDKVDKYKKMFKDIDIILEYNAFRGEWNNKKYPDSYTKQEIEIFNLNSNITKSPYIFNQKNKLCNAGYNIVVAKADGRIQTCFEINKILGSVYKDIKFNDSLIRCPFDFCGCPFSAFEPYLYNKALEENSCKISY